MPDYTTDAGDIIEVARSALDPRLVLLDLPDDGWPPVLTARDARQIAHLLIRVADEIEGIPPPVCGAEGCAHGTLHTDRIP
jgi:hypothetical protein